VPGVGRNRWKILSQYLDRALDLDDAAREAWLAALDASEPSVAADVRSLLHEHETLMRNGFLEDPEERAPLPPLAGRMVGAYRLVAPVGRGGMGVVWEAERSDGRFTGRAAVKLLNLALVGRAGEERFRREGGFLGRLTHPNIAHLLDAGVSDLGQPFLVLEFVEGEPIDRYCNRRRLGIEPRIRLFLDVLAAVSHAHANLIVHRDIKPSNVLVRADGQVKLLDFGIAKLLEEDTNTADATLTVDGGRALTPEYAAPEQMLGQPVTTATDVYALGVLLYVLLSGQHPAGGARTPAELLLVAIEGEPPRLSDVVAAGGDATAAAAAARGSTPEKLRRLLRGDLDTITAKALKRMPQERYASVEALADDLRRFLGSQPICARPDTLAYRSAKFVRRHARAASAIGAVLALLLGIVGYYTARVTVERDRARREAAKAAAVSSLLTSLLTGSDPYASQPAEPTLRGILDAGAERVHRELSAEPEVKAEMLTVIGRVYQRLGASDKARPLLEEAVAIGRRRSGPGDAQLAQALNDYGVLLRDEDDPRAAQPLLEEAAALRRRLLGPEHSELAVTLVELARAYSDIGQQARAEALFREALAMRRRLLGDDDQDTATSMNELALLLWAKGDLDEAERLFRHTVAVNQRTLGSRHPNIASASNNLGLVLGSKGAHAEAESLFRQALATHRVAPGDQHRSVASTLNNLSHALREQGKYREAAVALDEAMLITRRAEGDDHPTMATFMTNLARVHVARGAPAEAEPLLRRALVIRQRAFPDDDWRVAAVKGLLGASLAEQGRNREAEPLLAEATRVLKDIPGPQGRDAAAARERLASVRKVLAAANTR
jgi:serine/threonine protein kinase/Tfp pilus assembly protein PilF